MADIIAIVLHILEANLYPKNKYYFIFIYITFVYNRFTLTEVREGGKFRNAILLSEPLVVDFHEVDAKCVRVIVNLF